MGSGLEVLSAAMRALRAAADDSSGHHSSLTVNRAASAARRSVCVSNSGSCQPARRLGGRSAGLHCLNGTRSSPTGAFRQRVGNERGGDKRSVATTSYHRWYFSGTARTPLTPPSLSSASLPSARQASTSSSGSRAPDAPPALLRVSRLARAWVVPAGRRLATQARAPAVYTRARSVSITQARVLAQPLNPSLQFRLNPKQQNLNERDDRPGGNSFVRSFVCTSTQTGTHARITRQFFFFFPPARGGYAHALERAARNRGRAISRAPPPPRPPCRSIRRARDPTRARARGSPDFDPGKAGPTPRRGRRGAIAKPRRCTHFVRGIRGIAPYPRCEHGVRGA